MVATYCVHWDRSIKIVMSVCMFYICNLGLRPFELSDHTQDIFCEKKKNNKKKQKRSSSLHRQGWKILESLEVEISFSL